MDHSHSLHFRFPAWDLILMLSQSSNGIAQLWPHFGFKVLFRHDNPISSSESYGGPSGTVLKRAIRTGPSFLFEGQDHYYYFFFNKTHPHSYSLHTRILLVLPTSFLTILSLFAIHVIRVFERKVGKTMEWGFRQLHHHQFLTTLALNSAFLP